MKTKLSTLYLKTEPKVVLNYKPLAIILFGPQKLNFLQLDYEQSLFPLRDSREKRRACRAASVVSRYTSSSTCVSRFNAEADSKWQAVSRSLDCSFSSTIPEREERQLVVYFTVHCNFVHDGGLLARNRWSHFESREVRRLFLFLWWKIIRIEVWSFVLNWIIGFGQAQDLVTLGIIFSG